MSARDERPSQTRVPSAEELLGALLQAGVVLVADGEQLRVRAPSGALSPALREALVARRDRVRALVAERFRSPAECLAARAGAARPCRQRSPCARPVDRRPCLVPATCCLCGAPLPIGRRYLCPACTEQSAQASIRPTNEGDRAR